jgi:hypothetical protein
VRNLRRRHVAETMGCGRVCRIGWRRSPYRNPASAAKLIAFAIAMSADAAGHEKLGGFLGDIFGDAFGIRFHGKALHGLEGCGNGLLVRLGTTHFRIEPLIDLAQGRIARADARHTFGILRRNRTGRPYWLLVFVPIFVHDSDHATAAAILAQAEPALFSRGRRWLNFNGAKTRSFLPPRWARHCRLRDDSARCGLFAEHCGRPQHRRSAKSKDYARARRRR